MVTSVGQPADKVMLLLQMSIRMTLSMPSYYVSKLLHPRIIEPSRKCDRAAYTLNQVSRHNFRYFVITRGTQLAEGQ